MSALESAAPGILSLSTPRGRRVFALLVLTNGFVGTMIGGERTLVPLLGDQVFQVGSRVAVLSFIATFGIAKAFSNLAAGAWSDRVGRRRVLVAGWMARLRDRSILR